MPPGLTPTFPEKPKIRKAGKAVIFEVALNADPVPTLQWSKAGQLINTGGRYKTDCKTTGTHHIVSLEIGQVSADDAGEYLVNAKNGVGESTATINLNIGAPKQAANKAPKFLDKPKIRMDKAKGEVIMSCNLEAKPKANLTWWLNDVQIQEVVGKRWWVVQDQPDDVYILEIHIASPKPDDGGTYRINAQNSAGESNANINLNLQGSQKPPSKAPVFETPKIFQDKGGRDVVLECRSTGDPDPAYTWFQNERQLHARANKFQMDATKDGSVFVNTLRIINFMNADTGAYKLVAKNDNGEAKADMTVKMPKVIGIPSVRYENNNQRAILEVHVESGNLPTSVWTQASKSVPTTGRHSTDLKEEKNGQYLLTLTINDLIEKDSGVYECELSNGVGTAQASMTVKVSNKDQKPMQLPQIIGNPGCQQAEAGRTFILTVDYSAGSVTPSAQILKNGTQDVVTSGDKRCAVRVDADKRSVVLTMKNVTNDDKGNYQVQLLADGQVCDKTNFDLTVLQDDEIDEDQDEVGELKVPSSRNSRRGSTARKEEEFHKRRESQEKGGLLDPKALEQSLQARRDSMTNRRTSLAEAIPGFGGLKHRDAPKVEKELFLKELEDIKIKEGSVKALLKCTFCKPNARIRWSKNKLEIFQGPKYNFMQEGNDCALEIKRIAMEDVGKYTCKCNETSTTCTLVVTEQKHTYHFNQKLPKTAEVVRGKDLTVECSVSDPRAPVTWYHKGEKIEYVAGRVEIKRRENRCILRIVKAKAGQEGEYCCIVEGDETYLDMAVDDPDWFFTRELKAPPAFENDEFVNLECEVSDRDAEVTWFRNGQPIVASEKYEIVSEKRIKRILRIKKLDCNDDAEYSCKTAKKTTTVRLNVKPDVEFRQSLIDTKGIETKHKELECRAYNPKKYPVTWYKEGEAIVMDDRISTKQVDDMLYLIFQYLEMTDTGMYKCKIGSHETEGHLEVQECDKPPSADLSKFNNQVNLKRGQNWAAAIPFKGFPVPQVALFLNGQLVPETIKLKPVVKAGQIELKLDDAARADVGKYELKLRNDSGEVLVPFEINVYDRPGKPRGPLELTSLSAKKATLEWEPPEDDGGKPIKHYVVEKQDQADGQWKLVKNAVKPKADVDLEEGHKYKFRVRAVNDEGESENLETEKEILAHDICDPPDPPSKLEIEDYDQNHVDLKWAPPRKDNGAPITGYIIEAKPKSTGKWKPVADVPSTKAKVDLKEGEEYEFRVTAVNKAGKSAPSEVTKPMIAKPRFLKPFIYKNDIKPVQVKVGQVVQLDLTYRGEPDPVATWAKGTEVLETGEVFQLTFESRAGHLKIAAAERKYTALYNFKVVNEVGQDEASIEVVVLGRPSRPIGPLEVSEVTKNSAKLDWKKPEDDGGKPIKHYKVEKMNMNKGKWEPVAEVTRGTSCLVPKLDEGAPYKFRVTAVSDVGESEPLETESDVIAKNPYEKPGAPAKPEIADHDRDHIDIKWEPPQDDGGNPVKGYHIERREPTSPRWIRLTKAPTPDLTFTDDGVREKKEYEYRVIAVNDAGPGEPSPPSDIGVAKPSREAPKLSLKELPLGFNKEIRLRAGEPLHMPIPITGAPRPTIKWVKDGAPLPTYAKLLDEEEKTCLDIPRTVRGDSGDYKIELENDYGKDEAVVKVIVMDKPLAPENVEAIDVYEDRCVVTWKPPKDDGGCPITDYEVERCDASLGIWESVSGNVINNSIPVRNLVKGKQYKFRVKAVNQIGAGEPGETKASITAKNPYDPPGPPEKLDIDEFDRHSVTLVWKAPKDDGGNPIKGYLIEKRKPRGDWRNAVKDLVPGTKTKVKNVDEGQTYEFRVTAVNDAGPGEPSQTTKPHLIKDPTYPPGEPEGLTADKTTKNGARLSWNAPRRDGGAPVTGYVVEKKAEGDDDDKWVPVQETKEPCAFIPMKEGEKAQFRVKAVNSEGPGEPTKPTSVLTAEDKPEAPHIATPEECVGGPGSGVGGLKDITLKAGQPLRLAAAWFGHPKPTASWTSDDKPVKLDGKRSKASDQPPPPPANPGPGGVLEQSPGGTTVLEIAEVRRADGGNYELTLVNDQGQVKTSCHVEVLDVPGPCEGPLEAVDVDAEEITLKWKPPLDDGGQPISNYVLEKRPKGSDSWQKVSAFLNTPTTTVRNLEVGKEYEFRVMAENAMGLSEPLQTSAAIKAKHPYDPPSGMEKPKIEDTTDDSVTLSWEPPRKGPVTGYVVEKRRKGSNDWSKANPATITGTNYTVKGLPKGEDFQFRVVPYNLAGMGEPSEPTETVKVRFPITPPKISVDAPREIVAKVDEPFKIRIPFTGSPPDKVELSKNGLPIPLEGGRFEVEVTPNEVIITDKKAQKDDAGPYKIDLTNEKGTDSVPVNVKVVGPPEPPKGPLEISNVKADGCTLAWNPPSDTGGAPITNYVVEKQDTKTGEWTPVSSFVRLPMCDVTGLNEGDMYRFRVRAANEHGVSEPLDGEKSILAEDPYTVPGAPSSLTPTDVDATEVELEWKKPRSDGGRKIKGYVVEYKTVNEDDWHVSSTEGPAVKGTKAKVDGLKKGQKYMFRVSAKNEAGLGEPCTANRPVECKPKYTAPDSPGQPQVEDVGKTFVDLSWPKPLKDGGARVTGYLVEKRKKFAPDWEPATPDGQPVSANKAHIEGLDANDEYEFRVIAVNLAGPGDPSPPTELTKIRPKRDIPQSPESLEVTDVFADNCKLTWIPPAYDGGCPITDYIVEKCDPAIGDWERVPTHVTDTSCPVKGLVEGKRYLFRVSAVNMMGPSEPVEANTAITAKNPFDAPDAPENAKIDAFDKHGVDLSWKAPEDDGGNPIKGFLVEKRKPNGEWKPATAGLVPGEKVHLTSLEPGETYEFRVSAVNDAGPGRPSKTTKPQIIKDPTYPPSAPEELSVDKVNKNGVKLTWKKPRKDGGAKINGYDVEKKDDDGNWVPVKHTTEPCAFIPLKEGEKGQFRVRAVNEEGPGEPTKPTSVLTAEDQPEAPHIATPDDCVPLPGNGVGGLKDIKVKAGQDIRLAAAWFGSPAPTMSWTLKDKPIKIDGSKTVESSEPTPPAANPGPGGQLELSPGATEVLTVKKASRADTGEYKLTIANPQGQATSTCNVEVIDVPGTPSGPLEALEVKADEITLTWKAPEDDGGEPVTNYILEKKPKNSPTWERVSAFLNQPTATVRNLETGTEYEFRVMAENAMGVSEPLTTSEAIKAKHPFNPPSGMSKPSVEGTTDDSVTLAWEPPRKGPVSGYMVERRPKGEKKWTNALPSPVTGTGVTVKNLPTGKEFEFRVVPINAAGPGEPSEPTEVVKVQNPVVAPKIGIDAPREVIAKIDEPCKIRIPYTGSPPDKVELTKNGIPVPLDTDRFQVEVRPDEVVITDKKVRKDDAGPYEVTLENEKGKATAPFNMKVQGPPESPEGPLEVSDVTAESCKLSWKPPADTGGSPVTNYVVEKLDKKTNNWVPVSRFVRQPEYEVTGLDEGETYKFRVRAENENGVSEPLEAERSITAENPTSAPDAPGAPTVVDVDGDSVKLQWKKPRKDGGRPVKGYVVEYKPVNSDEWKKMPTTGKEPSATVDGLKKGEKYVFRVAAKNDVGTGEPSETTRPVEVKPKYTTADSPGRPIVDDVDKGCVDLSWPAPVKDGGAKITGYVVEKRKKNAPDWEPVSDKPFTGTHAHVDGLDDNGEYEFRVKPVNAAGVGEPSEPTDMTKIKPKKDKPETPGEVDVEEMFADHCKLAWKAPTNDGGSPISGYLVEINDATSDVWEKVPNFGAGTSCPIKDLVEGKRYRFRVSAVNALGASEPCEANGAFTAKNPFDAPDSPDQPNIDSFDKHSVDLSWNEPKYDGGNPIKGYLIEKRTPKGEWKPATAGLVSGPDAHVTGLEPGKTYEFRVSAVNEAGPGRPSRATAPHEAKDPVYPAAPPESVKVDKVNKNGCKLEWQKPRKDGGSKITGYQVEKKDDNGNWVPVKQTTEPCAFIPMKEGETSQFRVKAINDEGPGEPSKPTPPVTAEDQPESPRICTPNDCVGGPGTGVGGLKDVKVKAGQDLKLPVAWFGSPKPTFTWTLNGEPIQVDGKRTTLTDEGLPPPAHPGPGGVLEQSPGGTVCLNVGKVRRGDKGKYKLTVQNELGQATTSCEVEVLDAPAAPGGPLEATSIKPDEVTLVWKAPEDDGGEPVTNYVLEKRPKGSDTWQKVSGFLKTPTATVRNLDEGKEYEFRVMAENPLGVSEPLVTTKPIVPRHPFDPPSGMSKPTVEDTTDDSVTLSWDVPEHGPTSGYIVEKRPKGERNWTKVNPHPTTGNELTVKNLPTGKEFEFRVVPVNAAGPGEPSESTGPVKVQKPVVAPKIGRDAPREVKAVEGEPFKVRIPYTGSPPKEVEITKDGKPFPIDNNRFQVEITPDEVIITDRKAEKPDAGKYDIKLKNEKGEDSLPVAIKILGAPEPPKGPLEVDDITADSVTLKWRPPEDDGGTPVSHYVVEKQDQDTGDWVPVSKFVRKPEYTVNGLDEGKQYKFRVRAANDNGVGEPLEAERAITAENPSTVPEAPGKVDIADVDKDSVTLQWTKPKDDGGGRISGYVVEMKPVDGDEWEKAPTGPVKGTTATVTGLKPGEKYVFRVAAKNDAGVGDRTRPTRPVECKPKYTSPSGPKDVKVDGIGKNHVDLSWDRPNKDGGGRILGYVVEKRKKDQPDWEPVNPDEAPITGTYAHVDGLDENDDYQFRVRAVNPAGPGEPSNPTPMVKVEERKPTALPEFVTKLHKTTAPIGGKATFEADVDGQPMPKVKWFRDGIELTPSSRVKIQSPGPDGKVRLELDDLDDHDSGTITCQVSNPGGKSSCSAPLEVLAVPKVVGDIADKLASEGDLVKFKVPYVGHGNIELKLKLDGREVPESDKVKLMDLDGMASVQLKDVSPEMGGRYTLEISNESGTTSVPFNFKVQATPDQCQGPLTASDTTPHSTRLSWKPPRQDGGAKITGYVVEKYEVGRDRWIPVSCPGKEPRCEVLGLQPDAKYKFRVAAVNDCGQGDWLDLDGELVAKYPFDRPEKPGNLSCDDVGSDFVNLTWTRPKSDGGGRIHGYVIEKREVGAPNWSRVNQNPTLTTSFNVPNLIEDKTYEFRVRAVNDAGDGEWVEIDRPVLVKDPKAVTRPSFVGSLRPQTVHEGRDVVFEIEVDCTSPYEISWMKGPHELVPSHRIDMTKEGKMQVLTIHDCSLEDAEEYSVRVSNAAGSKQSRADLAVKAKPAIHLTSRWLEPTEWDKGDTINLKVPYTASPKPSVKWTLNGKELREGKGITSTLKDRHVILNLENVSEALAGKLTLTLENEMGSDSATVELRVNDRPPPPINLKVEGVSDGSALLSWGMPAGTGYISQYIIERREMPGDAWIRAGTNRFSTYNCEGLRNGSEYQFRVIAENLHGRSDPCEPTAVTPIQADPRKTKGKRDPRGEYDGPPIDNYDKFHRDIWKGKEPLPAQSHKGESIYDYYDVLEELGRGTFGVVHRCREKSTGNFYAVKFVDTPTPKDKQVVRSEIDLMKSLHHPKLLHLHEAFEDDDETAIVMELLTGGELLDKISDSSSPMTEADAINYIRQVCEGVRHMHDNNIMHLDLKPEDIMCETSKSDNVKLIDFGMSKRLNPKESVRVSTANPEFCAPEVARYEPVGFYTDMWSIGTLSHLLLSGLSPFAGSTPQETLDKVSSGKYNLDHEAFDKISPGAKDFISKLLKRQPNERMTIYEALSHPWLTSTPTDDQRQRIPASRYKDAQTRMHERIGENWQQTPSMGHLANYSSLRQNRRDKYKIHDTEFDRREAGPRFVRWPHNQTVEEGTNAQFDCRILALSEPIVSWLFGDTQLSQSIKYMQRYAGHDYSLKINRAHTGDQGHYTVRAENSFGRREYPVMLTVLQSQGVKRETTEPPQRRKFHLPEVEMFHVEDVPPKFAFHLRDRYIQEGSTVKLTCTADGHPTPRLTWYKDGRELRRGEGNHEVTTTLGISSLELYSCTPADTGRYSCVATNSRGESETSCKVNVEESRVRRFLNARSADRSFRAQSHQPGYGSVTTRESYSSTSRSGDRMTGRNLSEVRETIESTTSTRRRFDDDFSTPSTRRRHETRLSTATEEDDLEMPAAATRRRFPETLDEELPIRRRPMEDDEPKPVRVEVAPSLRRKLDENVNVSEGESLKLEVELNKVDPSNKVTWYHNGRDITDDANYYVVLDGASSQLIIRETNESHSGIYEVRISNSSGKSSSQTTVTIIVKSKLTTDESSMETIRSDETVTKTTIDDQSVKSKLTTDESSMETIRSDETVTKTTIDDQSEFTSEDVSSTLRADDSRHTTTTIVDESTDSTVIDSTSSTTKLDQDITSTVVRSDDLTTTTVVDDSTTVMTDSVDDSSKTTTSTVEVKTIHMKYPDYAPYFVTQPRSQVGTVGGTVVLECEVGGMPLPETRWTFNGGEDIQCSHQFNQDNEKSRLELIELELVDTGTYECRATSTMGEASTLVHLMVKSTDDEPTSGPEFLTYPQSTTLRVGESASFECTFPADSVSSVTWTRDGVTLPAEFDASSQKSKLTLSNASVTEHSGVYTIVALDSASSSSSTWAFAVQVLEVDFPPTTPVPVDSS